MTTFRHSASFGKRQEYIAIAELLKRGFDVYMTLVDDQGIDCVIRIEEGRELRYLDIQIKARSADCLPKNAGTFANIQIPNPRPNYFFIFYSEQAEKHWVIPSLALAAHASRRKSGDNVGSYTIKFTNHTSAGVTPRPKFVEYEGAFHLLQRRI